MQGIGSIFAGVRNSSTEVKTDNISDEQLIGMPAPRSINRLLWKHSNPKKRRQLLKQSTASSKSKGSNAHGLTSNAAPEQISVFGVSIGSVDEMIDIIKRTDEETLTSATPNQRGYILKNLTGKGDLDYLPNQPSETYFGLQTAITKLLKRIDSSQEMNHALADIGGIDLLITKLTDRFRVTEFIEHLISLGEEQDSLIIDIISKVNQTNPNFEANLNSLLQDDKFQNLSRDEKLAILNQLNNYPDEEVVQNIQRLLQQPWFREEGLTHKQRSLMTCVSLTVHLSSLVEDQGSAIFNIVSKVNQTGPDFATNLNNFLKSEEFQSLSEGEKLAVLCQINNHPDAEAVGNLERLYRGNDLPKPASKTNNQH